MSRLAGKEIRIPRPVPNQTDHSNCSRGSSNYVGARTSCEHASCTCSVAHTTCSGGFSDCSGGRHTCSDEPRICSVALHSSGYVFAPAVPIDALAVQAFAPAMLPNPFAVPATESKYPRDHPPTPSGNIVRGVPDSDLNVSTMEFWIPRPTGPFHLPSWPFHLPS